MMCPIRFVVRPSLVKILMSALTLTAWLFLGSAVARHCDEVQIHLRDASIQCRPLSVRRERAYPSNRSQRPDRIDLQLGEGEIRVEPLMHSQPMSVAFMA